MIFKNHDADWIAESRPLGDGMMELTFNDGRKVVRSMPVNEDGEAYMEMFPNHPETHLPTSAGFYDPPLRCIAATFPASDGGSCPETRIA